MKYLKSFENKLVGGKGDKTLIKDVDKDELKVGIAVEKEHTKGKNSAKEIALDHLTEDPKYYSQLISSGLADEEDALDIAKELGWKLHESANNNQEVKDKLGKKLLSFGGSVGFAQANIEYKDSEIFKKILYEGKVYYDRVIIASIGGIDSDKRVAEKYRRLNKRGFKIIVGYALDNRGVWHQHSWGHTKMGIIETTHKYAFYYGYELTPKESVDFCFRNY